MILRRLDHVAVQVPIVNQAVQWYAEVLRLRQIHAAAWGNFPAMMATPSGTGIALFERGTAEPHVAFGTHAAGLAEAQAVLSGHDIPYEYEDHGPTHSIYFRDPFGNRLEITTEK